MGSRAERPCRFESCCPERDKIKDNYLSKNGWHVYRIKWKSINQKSGKEYIKNEIVKFIDFYKQCEDAKIED